MNGVAHLSFNKRVPMCMHKRFRSIMGARATKFS